MSDTEIMDTGVDYGRVAIIPRGDWNAETEYQVGDLVYSLNGSYVAYETPTIGVQPGSNTETTWTSFWMASAINGINITSIEQTGSSTVSGEKNTITVTLGDGTVTEFTIYNGIQGEKGDKGDIGISVSSVEQTVTSTENGGVNTIEVTLTDGTKSEFNVRNGEKGEAGGVQITHVDTLPDVANAEPYPYVYAIPYDSGDTTVDSNTPFKLYECLDGAWREYSAGIQLRLVGELPATAEIYPAVYATPSPQDAALRLLYTKFSASSDWTQIGGSSSQDGAEEYDSAKSYAVGDYVLKDGTLYVVTSTLAAGAWDESCVESTNVLNEITKNSNAVATAQETAENASIITDDTTGTKYRFGIDDGIVYLETVATA